MTRVGFVTSVIAGTLSGTIFALALMAAGVIGSVDTTPLDCRAAVVAYHKAEVIHQNNLDAGQLAGELYYSLPDTQGAYDALIVYLGRTAKAADVQEHRFEVARVACLSNTEE